MKKQFVNLLVLFFLFQNLMSQDPRIILTPERITDLKAKISVAGTHHNELFKAIRTRVNKNDVYEYGTFSSMNYARSFYAVECALLYRLTDSSYYAQKAYNLLEEMYTSGEAGTPTIPELGSYPPSPQAGSKALTYAFPSVAYGLCYDWARNDWSQAQKDYVIDSIKAGLDDWEALFRWELYNMPTSNWVSVCRGAEILMMLGAGEETNRPDRYEGIKDSIRHHYAISYGPSGYTYEGLGYIHYGTPFAMAAMFAARSINDTSLNVLFRGRDLHYLLMYTFSFTPDRIHLMTAVDGSAAFGEGLFGLMFGNIKGDDLSYYKYFYDRHIGIHSSTPDSFKYDQKRLGAVWNLIYYPEDSISKDPNHNLSPVLADNQFGAYFMRNRWKNENDILFDIMGKYERHDYNSWKIAETFNISMLGYNTQFIGQCGKSYDQTKVSSLLVDSLAWDNHYKEHRDTGYLETYEEKSNGAYIIINGGQKYSYLGLSSAKRHLNIEFTDDSTAVISTLDQLEATNNHYYRWQINPGNEDGLDGVNVNTGIENNHSYFLLEGANNSYVKGWYVNDTNISFDGTDPLFAETSHVQTTDIWVVMMIGSGTPPVGSFDESGLNTRLTINNQKQIYYDDLSDRIMIGQSIGMPDIFSDESTLIELYPNPADRFINVKSTSPLSNDIINVTLTDMTGKILLTKKIKERKAMISVVDFKAGVYILKVSTYNHSETHKLIIR